MQSRMNRTQLNTSLTTRQSQCSRSEAYLCDEKWTCLVGSSHTRRASHTRKQTVDAETESSTDVDQVAAKDKNNGGILLVNVSCALLFCWERLSSEGVRSLGSAYCLDQFDLVLPSNRANPISNF